MGASVQATNQGGNGPTVVSSGPTFLGVLSLLQPQYRWTVKNYFAYNGAFQPLAGNATATVTLSIAADTDFIITYANCIVTDTTNLIQLPFIPQLVQLQDTAAGYQFFLQAAHAMTVYGDAQNPGIFAVPRVMRRATQLSVVHQNLEATSRNAFVFFNGFKSWPNTDVRQARWQDSGN